MLLEGMHLPLTTPFTAEGRLNLRKLEQNVRHYSLAPAAGMIVLGQTGEAELLSDGERREVLATAITAALPTRVMIAGAGQPGVQETLGLIEDAAAMSYDAAAINQPLLTLSEKERRVYFQIVADRAALPVILAGRLPLALVAEMAAHANVLGWIADFAEPDEIRSLLERTAAVKRVVTVTQVFAAVTGRMLSGQAHDEPDGLLTIESLSSGSAAVAASPGKPLLKTRTKGVGFQVLAGGTEQMLAGLAAGAVGTAPPFAAAAPQGCYEVFAAWKDGDNALAEEKQLRLVAAVQRIEAGLGVAGLKYGCDLNGYFGGSPRLPLLPITGTERLELESLMAGLKS